MAKKDDLLSESMEMYLVTIARLRKDGRHPVPLSQLAEALSVTPVSINEMCRKLQDSGYLVYRPYKGALLTETGEKFANHILRRHCLWEVFLVEKLHFGYQEASEAACALEHVIKDEVIDRLDEFLDFPTVDSRGLPIPTPDGKVRKQKTIPLSKMPVGRGGHVLQCNVSEEVKNFLEQYHIHTGMIVTVIAAGGNEVLVKANNAQITLSNDITEKIIVALSQTYDTDNHGKKIVNEASEEHEKEVYLQMKTDKDSSVMQIPLSTLKKGQHGIIVHVGGKGAVKRRMMDMGVVPGSKISVVRVAPLGDPIEFNIKGYSLSLRKNEAEQITVERIDNK